MRSPRDIMKHAADAPARQGAGTAGGAAPLSQAEFGRLFEAHHKALWAIAVGVVQDRTLAHDIVQEAAVIALGKKHEFDSRTSFPAWAGQIVRFVALNEGRKRNRQRAAAIPQSSFPGPVARAPTPAPVSSGTVGAAGFRDGRLAAALDTLDDTARSCLIMRTVLDMPYAQIAESLGVPEGTAMSHVHRARAALRKALGTHNPSGPEGGAR
ncbi:MAG: RNA polymerase sigma factor [Phycisphaerales bacterium]